MRVAMARHFITERTAIKPGVINTVCTCGTAWILPAREIDAVVNEHLGQPDLLAALQESINRARTVHRQTWRRTDR